MTAIATGITRDEAKELARERLTEVLAEVVPGFRPERSFRCLSPNHEDRHPSARYLSRTNTVKCFACGWSGDVFDVVGAVYGLAGGDAFAKVYNMLGLDPKGDKNRHAKPRMASLNPPKESALSAEWLEYFRGLIYPPGWDAVDEIKLPLPLEVTAEAETGLAGILARNPVSVFVCLKSGLRAWHFDDAELGEFFEDVRTADFLDNTNPEFMDWLRERAAPVHMLRKLSRFIMREGQRRNLEAAFAMAYSSLQNQEPSGMVLEDVLNQAELTLDCRFDPPAMDGTAMHELVADIFQRFHDGDDVLSIVERFRRTSDSGASI